MPTREQVRQLAGEELDYVAAGERLGIPPGQAYLIATGQPADGGDTPSRQQAANGGLLASSQHLANPPHVNPTGKDVVTDWMSRRVAADPQMRAAASQRTPQSAPPDEADDHDVIAVLTRDHNHLRTLVQQLSALPGHKKGGPQDDIARRKSIVDLIAAGLSRHEPAEEKYLWPVVRRALPDGDAWADNALEQEQQGTETLAALGRLDPDSDEFDEQVENLVAQLRKHVAYEAKVFSMLRRAVEQDDRERLGEQILSALRGARTTHAADEGTS